MAPLPFRAGLGTGRNPEQPVETRVCPSKPRGPGAAPGRRPPG
ncbi:hypothetical protein KPATCC21470_7887 [Kitasatospora purpeofusca]